MVETVVAEGVPARVVLESGVWRGGASIFGAAVLEEALAAPGARSGGGGGGGGGGGWAVVLCDSFRGLPLTSLEGEDTDWW